MYSNKEIWPVELKKKKKKIVASNPPRDLINVVDDSGAERCRGWTNQSGDI